jgi:hypothetical protein
MNRFGGAMKIATAIIAATIVCIAFAITTATAAEFPPRWAYPENNPNYKPPVDDGNLVRVRNSSTLAVCARRAAGGGLLCTFHG